MPNSLEVRQVGLIQSDEGVGQLRSDTVLGNTKIRLIEILAIVESKFVIYWKVNKVLKHWVKKKIIIDKKIMKQPCQYIDKYKQ